MLAERVGTLTQRNGVRQFIKFCMVGATSFIIDTGIAFLLIYGAHLTPLVARTVSFTVAVTNGFILNQRWTFRAVGRRAHHEQYVMFFSVNVVGYLLNMGIMTAVLYGLTGQWNMKHPPKLAMFVSILVATGVVVFWNFFANKYWTFRHSHAGMATEA